MLLMCERWRRKVLKTLQSFGGRRCLMPEFIYRGLEAKWMIDVEVSRSDALFNCSFVGEKIRQPPYQECDSIFSAFCFDRLLGLLYLLGISTSMVKWLKMILNR